MLTSLPLALKSAGSNQLGHRHTPVQRDAAVPGHTRQLARVRFRRETRNCGMGRFVLDLRDFAASLKLREAEYDELGGLNRRDAHKADETSVIDVVLRHRGAIHFHKERLFRPRSLQRAAAALPHQE